MLIQPILIAIKESGERWEYRGTEDELGKPYPFKVYYNGLRKAQVPVGFRLDGASSPRFSWSVVGFLPRGIHDPAALVHDYLYENKGQIRDVDGYGITITRKQADKIFLKMLIACGVKSWHAKVAYRAVRIGGGRAWKKGA